MQGAGETKQHVLGRKLELLQGGREIKGSPQLVDQAGLQQGALERLVLLGPESYQELQRDGHG
jgi:hypothetical protein